MKRITAIAITAAAILGCSYVGSVGAAEVVPSYPIGAARMSLEGQTTVLINCDTKKVTVLSESTTGGYFSRQVKKQVHNICYRRTGTMERTYIFKMSNRMGAHNVIATQPNRGL